MILSRQELIEDFGDGKIPSGAQFQALIESILSRYDDGLEKTISTPLEVMAGSPTYNPVLSLMRNGNTDPQWVIALNAQGREGLNFAPSRSPEQHLLYLDRETGNVGLGIGAPQSHLHLHRDNAEQLGIQVTNALAGLNTHAQLKLQSDGAEGLLFQNGPARQNDGGPSTLTLRSQSGALRLQSMAGSATLLLNPDGKVGINQAQPNFQLDLGGDIGLNGNRIHFSPKTSWHPEQKEPGIFWSPEAEQQQANYGIYRTAGPWLDAAYQQLRIQFNTGIQLGAGTGPNAGHQNSYVEVVNGKGLMLSSGRLGIGTIDPQAALDVSNGPILINNSNLFNSSARPALSPARSNGEISGYNHGAIGTNDGFLRLSAGGGTSIWSRSYIDLSGYCSNEDMNQNIVFGTSGEEQMRLNKDGKLGINEKSPAAPLHVASMGKIVDGNGVLIGKLADQVRSTATLGELIGQMELGFAGYRDSEPLQVGAKITAFRYANHSGGNPALIQATELGFFTGPGITSNAAQFNTFHDTCLERLRIDKNGKVGISTTTPAGQLHVVTASSNGDVAAWNNGQLVVGKSPASGADSGGLGLSYHQESGTGYISSLTPGVAYKDLGIRAKHLIFFGNGTVEKLRVTHEGKTGILTSNPAGQLHVVTASSHGDVGAWANGQLVVGKAAASGSDSGALGLSYHQESNTSFISSLSPGISYRDIGIRANNFIFYNGGSERLRFTSDGKVGIGTASPASQLQVRIGSNARGISVYSETAGDTHFPYSDNWNYLSGNGSIFRTGPGTEFLRFDHNQQRIGIRTTSLSSVLSMKTPANVSGITVESESAGNSHFPHGNNWHYLSGNGAIFRNSAMAEKIKIDCVNGYIGIGTMVPAFPLHIATGVIKPAGAYYYMSPSSVNHYGGGGSASYSVRAEGRIASPEFNAYSDLRIKTSLGSSNSADDLAQLMQIQVRNYQFKDKPSLGFGVQKGLIAQELREILPEAVTESSNYVPDIFEQAEVLAFEEGLVALKLNNDHDLMAGDSLRVLLEENWLELEVAECNGTELKLLGLDNAPERIFVYGRRVDDFLSVDYNKVFCLGLSATQEIFRKYEQLESEHARLQARMAKMEAWMMAQGFMAEA